MIDILSPALVENVAAGVSTIGAWGYGSFRYVPRIRAQFYAAHTLRDGWRLKPARLRCVDPIDPIWYGIIPGRVILGWHGGQFVQAPVGRHVLLVAMSQEGKTTTIIVTTKQAWMGPCISTSTKPDILQKCRAIRVHRGQVWVFDPMQILGEEDLPPWIHRLYWSPLRGCTDFFTAGKRATALTAGAGKGSKDENHWRQKSTQYLAPLLFAAALDGWEMSDVRAWVFQESVQDAYKILENHAPTWKGDPKLNPYQQAMDNLASLMMRDPTKKSDEVGSIWSTLQAALLAFSNPKVLESANRAKDCDFDPYQFLGYDKDDESIRPARGKDHSLFIVAPGDPNTNLAPLTTGLLEETIEAAYAISDGRGGKPLERPLLLALDEIARQSPIPSFERLIGDGGGRGIVLVSSVQDMSQFSLGWNEHTERLVRQGSAVTVVLPGCTDPELLSMLEGAGGMRTIYRMTKTTGKTRGPRWWQQPQDAAEEDGQKRKAARKETKHTKVTTKAEAEHEVPRWPRHKITNIEDGTALVRIRNKGLTLAKTVHHGSRMPFAAWTDIEVPWGLEQVVMTAKPATNPLAIVSNDSSDIKEAV